MKLKTRINFIISRILLRNINNSHNLFKNKLNEEKSEGFRKEKYLIANQTVNTSNDDKLLSSNNKTMSKEIDNLVQNMKEIIKDEIGLLLALIFQKQAYYK